MQKTLEYWQEEAEANSLPRLNWAEILGVSLPVFVFDKLNRGWGEAEIHNSIAVLARAHTTLDAFELERLIRINISARISEYRRSK